MEFILWSCVLKMLVGNVQLLCKKACFISPGGKGLMVAQVVESIVFTLTPALSLQGRGGLVLLLNPQSFESIF